MQTGYIFAVFRLIFCPKPLIGHSFAEDKRGLCGCEPPLENARPTKCLGAGQWPNSPFGRRGDLAQGKNGLSSALERLFQHVQLLVEFGQLQALGVDFAHGMQHGGVVTPAKELADLG